VAQEENRFFLRATYYESDDGHFWLVDFVPHIQQIADLAEDIFTMPQIPAQVKQQTGEKTLNSSQLRFIGSFQDAFAKLAD
jgi:hypothetical protein